MTRFALRPNSYVMKRVSASLWGVTASRTVPLDKTSCIVENKRRVRVFRKQFLWHYFPALPYQMCLAREQLLPILFLFSVFWQMLFFFVEKKIIQRGSPVGAKSSKTRSTNWKYTRWNVSLLSGFRLENNVHVFFKHKNVFKNNLVTLFQICMHPSQAQTVGSVSIIFSKLIYSIVLNVRIIRIDKYLPTYTSDLFRTFVPLIGSDTS